LRCLALANAADRKVLRDRQSRKAVRMGFFSRFWGFPPLYRFARGSPLRYMAIIVLSLACAFLFSIATLLPLILKGPIEDAPKLSQRCGADVDCVATQVVQLSQLFFFPLGALIVCLMLGWLGQRLLRRLLRFSLEALQQADTRPPVLFLRAFRDDQIPLRSPKVALFGRVLELGRRSDSLDQLLLDEATSCGPVVGLGSPTDKRPPYGAARGYFTGETWQEAVANLAARSDFIVICIDDSDGVWWEVEQLVDRHLGKTLFLIHPRYARAAENASILGRISQYFRDGQEAEALHSAAPQTSGQSRVPAVIGFFRDPNGTFTILQTSTFSRFAYLMALRAFIRQRLPA